MSLDVPSVDVAGAAPADPPGTTSRAELSAAATSVLAMAAAVLAALGQLDPFSYLILGLALVSAPGHALLSAAERSSRAPQLGAMVALSVAVVTLIVLAMLWSTLWYPRLGMVLLLLVSTNLLIIRVHRPRWRRALVRAGRPPGGVTRAALEVAPALGAVVAAIFAAGWLVPAGWRSPTMLLGLLLALAWVAAATLTADRPSAGRRLVGLAVGLSGAGLVLLVMDLLRTPPLRAPGPGPVAGPRRPW